MTTRFKYFLLGFLTAAALFTCCAWVFTNLRDAAIRSKSKRFFSETRALDEVVLAYRDAHGEYPRTKADVVAGTRRAASDFDYFVQDGHYTLIYPSLTGTLRWEPYVFQDGVLAAYPTYMEPEMAALHLHRGSALPREPVRR
jgi:hypothetical protein